MTFAQLLSMFDGNASGDQYEPKRKSFQPKQETELETKQPEEKKAAPVEEAPVKAPWRKASPVKEAPVKAPWMKASPVKEAPVKAPWVKSSPAKEEPVKEAPAKAPWMKASPVNEAPVKAPWIKSSPAKEAPVKEVPVKAPWMKASPVKEAPGKAPWVKESPAKEAPGKAPWMKPSPVKASPVKEALVKASPVKAPTPPPSPKSVEPSILEESNPSMDEDDESMAIPAPPAPPAPQTTKLRIIHKTREQVQLRNSMESVQPLACANNNNRPSFETSATPSKYIQNMLQYTAPANKPETMTSSSRMRNAIQDAQDRVFYPQEVEVVSNENQEPSGPGIARVAEFDQLYQDSLSYSKSGESELSIRTGKSTGSESSTFTADDLKSMYRERRLQRRKPHKKLSAARRRHGRRTSSSGDSVTSAPARLAPTHIDEMGFATFH